MSDLVVVMVVVAADRRMRAKLWRVKMKTVVLLMMFRVGQSD